MILIVTVPVFFSLLLAPPSAAENLNEVLVEVGRKLSDHKLLCAEFEQQKFMKVLKRPLVSKGRFIFSTGQGVLWQVNEPFPAKVLIREQGIVKWSEDGKPNPLGLSQSPLFQAMTKVFLSVFSGKISELANEFTISSIRSDDDWILTLIPKHQELGRLITAIDVEGDNYVQMLHIAETRGDRTEIQFRKIDGVTCQLNTEEKKAFAF